LNIYFYFSAQTEIWNMLFCDMHFVLSASASDIFFESRLKSAQQFFNVYLLHNSFLENSTWIFFNEKLIRNFASFNVFITIFFMFEDLITWSHDFVISVLAFWWIVFLRFFFSVQKYRQYRKQVLL
jgi:hypothetical protein